MCVFTLSSVNMQGFNLFYCQSTPDTYFPYVSQTDPRLHMVLIFIGWIYDLPICCQLSPIVYSIVYDIFSYANVFPLLVITPIVLDFFIKK